MTEIIQPNFTQVPNVLFDEWMHRLSPAAFKVIMCLCRKTFGWHKTSDAISKSQLIKVTGLSKNTIQEAIKELEKHTLIQKLVTRGEFGYLPNSYKLFIKKPLDEKYSDPPQGGVDQNLEGVYQNLGGGRSEFDPGVGQNLTQGRSEFDPTKERQTKERQTKERKYSSDPKIGSEQRPKISFSFSSLSFEGVSEEQKQAWCTAYPEINLPQELAKSIEWLKSNPSKAKKKNWLKFLNGWFSRANEKAENKKAYNSQNKEKKSDFHRTKNKDGSYAADYSDAPF